MHSRAKFGLWAIMSFLGSAGPPTPPQGPPDPPKGPGGPKMALMHIFQSNFDSQGKKNKKTGVNILTYFFTQNVPGWSNCLIKKAGQTVPRNCYNKINLSKV